MALRRNVRETPTADMSVFIECALAAVDVGPAPQKRVGLSERSSVAPRAECLDWVLIRTERHLDRPYLITRRFESANGVERTDPLGGLLHEYRIAA
jgi:hypothetical protein